MLCSPHGCYAPLTVAMLPSPLLCSPHRCCALVAADSEEEEGDHYKDMVERDERRWKRADKNGDGKLDKDEFTDFLHPEEAEHMRELVVQVSAHRGRH